MWHDIMISWYHNMTCTYMHGRCRKRCDHSFSGLPKVAFLSLHFLRRDSGHFAMTHWVPKWQRQTPRLWTLLVPMALHGANGFDYDEGTCCMYHQVGLRSLHTVILETKALKQKLAKITTCWPLKRCLCQDGLQFFEDLFELASGLWHGATAGAALSAHLTLTLQPLTMQELLLAGSPGGSLSGLPTGCSWRCLRDLEGLDFTVYLPALYFIMLKKDQHLILAEKSSEKTETSCMKLVDWGQVRMVWHNLCHFGVQILRYVTFVPRGINELSELEWQCQREVHSLSFLCIKDPQKCIKLWSILYPWEIPSYRWQCIEYMSNCIYLRWWRQDVTSSRVCGNVGFACKTRSKRDGGTPKTR